MRIKIYSFVGSVIMISKDGSDQHDFGKVTGWLDLSSLLTLYAAVDSLFKK